MSIQLRTPTDSDWTAILGLAQAAVPWDEAGNREWLENRKRFVNRRRHYLAEDSESRMVIGYGGIEEGPEPGLFRMFVVMDARRLLSEPGEVIYEQLAADLKELKAREAWAREYGSDQAIQTFFTQKGFVETRRFTLEGKQEMVVISCPLQPNP